MEIEFNTIEYITLTNLLKNREYIDILDNSIQFPKKPSNNLIIEKKSKLKHLDSIIGTSYDYSIRILINIINNRTIFDSVAKSIGYRLEKNKDIMINDFNLDYKKDIYSAVITLSIQLASNEIGYRIGKKSNYQYYSNNRKKEIYNETIKLIDITLKHINTLTIDSVNYNPEFNYQNIVADGDIIINDTLIDFKTNSTLNAFKNHIRQIVSYYLLNKKNNKDNIKKLSLYYPRFNSFESYNIEDIVDTNKLDKIIF